MSVQMPVLKEPERKRRGNKKLLAIVILLFMALLAVLFFNSSISKISEIQISGLQYTTNAEVVEAAGIETGDAFFRVSSASLAERVSKLPEVEKVDVTKSFPGVIKLKVQEYPVVAFELSSEGSWVALLSNGTETVDEENGIRLADKPVLTGWSKEDPVKKELTAKLAAIPSKQLSDLSEIMPDPSTAYPDRIRMYTRTKFEVITAVSVLTEKIEALNAVIETQEPGKITMLLADTYVPFDQEDSGNSQNGQKDTTQ
ncbi:FtsQ-type POTRA domain-containing protein [Paenibacillus sp. HB172176]|uniref:cell division protein FtsQ/DivIB n=1 Tax=Paenibacillus sp. HB172176 TaxID=2493690 RepID=UPI00143A96C9|nr:FtsQ-type POTRA domain-containing protein [Paenibacillus sp. HB172176]